MPSVTRVIGGGEFPDAELEGDDGLFVVASVWCHECGAEGPSVDGIAYDRSDCEDMEKQAVDLWQARCNKNRSLYDSGERRGLNQYPRES